MPMCNEDGCEVLVTGKCINGLALDECPHYLAEDADNHEVEEIEDDTAIEQNQYLDVIDVYDGKALPIMGANAIASESLTRLIILAGMPDSGKTTLLLSLMHIFATNVIFEGYLFAGSKTLMDFEEKSHPSRIDSNNVEEITGRTPLGPPNFLHIKVLDKLKEEFTDLLFTDISGEDFRILKDSSAECKKFTIGQRADHFALFIDTQRVTNVGERATAKASSIGILRSLIEAGTLLHHTRIQIVFSRWDLKSSSGGSQNDDDFINFIKEDILKQFGDQYEIVFFEVAARPKTIDGNLHFGYGIDKIFPNWVKGSILNKAPMNITKSDLPLAKRQYLQFHF